MNLFFMHGLQLVGIDSKHFENRGWNLLVGDGSFDGSAVQAWVGDQQCNVGVVFIEATMLGDLRASGKDDAGVDLENDVRSARIVDGTVEFVL